jgi:hypothetical protein
LSSCEGNEQTLGSVKRLAGVTPPNDEDLGRSLSAVLVYEIFYSVTGSIITGVDCGCGLLANVVIEDTGYGMTKYSVIDIPVGTRWPREFQIR